MRRDEAAMKVRIHGEPPIGPFPDIVAVDNELRRPTACQAMQRMLLWAFRYINTRTWMELLYSAISRTRTQTGLAPQTGLVPTQQMTSRKLLVFKSPQHRFLQEGLQLPWPDFVAECSTGLHHHCRLGRWPSAIGCPGVTSH
ncbi:uncharacterized protein LOC144107912 isoform X3 [Amblyomma americanum]